MAVSQSTTRSSFFRLSQSLWFLTLFASIAALELQLQSSRSQFHDYQNLEMRSANYSPRRGTWATSRLYGRPPTFREALMSIFKKTDFGDAAILVVCSDGSAPYSTVQEAVDQVPDNNTRRTVIYITSGVYEEKVTVPMNKPYITFQGEGTNRTIITWNDTAAAAGTLMSATVVVESDHFIARDISFRNSAGRPIANITNMQAAAFRISGDMAFLYRCNFYGYQDTLYDHTGRHYYYRCFIQGSEDFVFGIGRALFERCWLNSVALGEGGALVAQGKYYPGDIMGESGFSFVRCIVTGSGRPYLGRAWGQYSTVVYSYCLLNVSIHPDGWYDWGLAERDRSVFFGQYKCSGIGANTTGRVYWARELTDEEAQPFLGIGFIDGPWENAERFIIK